MNFSDGDDLSVELQGGLLLILYLLHVEQMEDTGYGKIEG
jgi:hypothetical protein